MSKLCKQVRDQRKMHSRNPKVFVILNLTAITTAKNKLNGVRIGIVNVFKISWATFLWSLNLQLFAYFWPSIPILFKLQIVSIYNQVCKDFLSLIVDCTL